MAALAVAVIGGPMTMAMLVLEATHDFSLAGATIAAALVSSTIVRETFGYSFSTWRLHLRGETIKSARDVGWVRMLTAGRMMRKVERPTPARITVAEFRRIFPLGSTSRVVVIDDQDRYAGIVQTASAFAEGVALTDPVGTLAIQRKEALSADADIKSVMSEVEEAMVVAFRPHTLLPLDAALYEMQPSIPHLIRSALHRCLQRHGISHLPAPKVTSQSVSSSNAIPLASSTWISLRCRVPKASSTCSSPLIAPASSPSPSLSTRLTDAQHGSS
jgi:hypothetical protein